MAGRYLGLVSTVMYPVVLRSCRRAVIGMMVVLLVGCGSTAGPASPQTVVLRESDAGRTVQVRSGDAVQVKLVESFPVPGSSLVWDVSSSAASVLAPGKVTRDPAERPRIGQVDYTAEFTAQSSGRALLVARGSTTCEAMTKEGCPNRDFTITVEVT